MEENGLYEKVLARIAQGAVVPRPRPPRASAGVVPWRRDANGVLEVYWLRRSEGLRFMPGFHAFPGGGLSKADREVEVAGSPRSVDGAAPAAELPEAVLAGVDSLAPILEPGLVVCALRELFEETGLLPLTGSAPPVATLGAARRRLVEGEVGFAALLDELGLRPDAARLVYAGRWLTPPLGPLRFDNRFFLLEWPATSAPQPQILAGEVDHGEWIEPGRALARWRSGEVTTAPPILHILRVLDEEGPEAGLERLQAPSEANLGPHRRIEFRPGVLLFPVRTPTLPPVECTNAYLLGTGETVLVDPGSPWEEENERLGAALEAAERLGLRLTAIWLTHHHPDHVGGVEAMRRRFGVPVLAHEKTARLLADRGLRIDGELEDGSRVLLEGDPPFPVRVLHTPGHARGHLAFLDETFESLVCGDLVSGASMIVIDPPQGDMDVYLESLERMRDREPAALFPAHGPPTCLARARLQAVIDHRLWREDRISRAWARGLRTAAELLPVVYDDVPELAHPLAERQLQAHLERLHRHGWLG